MLSLGFPRPSGFPDCPTTAYTLNFALEAGAFSRSGRAVYTDVSGFGYGQASEPA